MGTDRSQGTEGAGIVDEKYLLVSIFTGNAISTSTEEKIGCIFLQILEISEITGMNFAVKFSAIAYRGNKITLKFLLSGDWKGILATFDYRNDEIL